VADNNIYRWAGMLLSEASRLVEDGDPPAVVPGRPVGFPIDGPAALCGPLGS